MDQKITIKIGEREYVLRAATPQSEELMRLSAEAINRKLAAYQASFQDKNMVDLLSFVALSEGVSRISTQRKLDALQNEGEKLTRETGSYLKTIDKK